MDKWVLWLGELVWRIGKWPDGIRGNKSDEEFWFRLYAVLTLLLSLIAGMITLRLYLNPLSELLIMLGKYTGADKILAQGYIGAGIILLFAAPIIFCAAGVLASCVAIVPGVGLKLSKFVAWASLKWATKFKKKQEAREKELSPEDRQRLGWMFLGMLAAFILWLAVLATKDQKPGGSPPEPQTPDDDGEATPPAA